MYVFAEYAIAFFGLADDALQIGVSIVRFIATVFWLFAVYITVSGLLQGAGDTILMSIATLSALVIRIITGYAAVGLGWLGPEAAWVTMPIGWVVAILITFIRYFSGGWKKKAVVGKLKKGI